MKIEQTVRGRINQIKDLENGSVRISIQMVQSGDERKEGRTSGNLIKDVPIDEGAGFVVGKQGTFTIEFVQDE